MRSKFDEQLALMKNELIQMGALCEEAISLAAKALTEGDKTLAEKVGPLDGEIDQMERDIETGQVTILPDVGIHALRDHFDRLLRHFTDMAHILRDVAL